MTAPLGRDSRVFVAGHRGLVGSALWRYLSLAGIANLHDATSAELDLRETAAVDAFYR